MNLNKNSAKFLFLSKALKYFTYIFNNAGDEVKST